ncbi:hypothetical protein Athai_42990 [Actinocatenispora thailandica]|uniref:Uncharacterized protein n=1 Tax=Actinocatenispora thailandica TaxID=227318 RepID=A0A7R7DS94_9ACTN|nr:hypothetical protein Athai_42990 [Actinocatenispora thailandica]
MWSPTSGVRHPLGRGTAAVRFRTCRETQVTPEVRYRASLCPAVPHTPRCRRAPGGVRRPAGPGNPDESPAERSGEQPAPAKRARDPTRGRTI